MVDTLIIFFSGADKVVIKHYYQKWYTTYKIWKNNPEALGENFIEASYKEIWSIWYHEKTKRLWPSENSNNSFKQRICRRNYLFSRTSSSKSFNPKIYCQRIKDLTIFCAENDQKNISNVWKHLTWMMPLLK